MLKLISLIIFCFLITRITSAQSPQIPVVNDVLSPPVSVQLNGFVGDRLNASYQNRILAQDVDRLISPFRNRTETSCWQSEFWGKWFTSAVLAYKYLPDPQLKRLLDYAIDGLIATQASDGYIGNYADDKHLQSWDIWGRKYCMLGLLSYFDLTHEQKALEAAAKVADHMINELKKQNVLIVKLGNHRGMAASSVLEPVCLLYSRTGDEKYLAFAEEIVRQWETPDGPQLISKAGIDVSERFPKPVNNWYGWEQGQKAYEMMSCYEGLLELYRLTGKEIYKEAVVKTWQNIFENEINIAGSGSAMECWFNGKEMQVFPVLHYQETCVSVTWIKLSQQLLRITGKAKYADVIEQTYYNALLGAMKSDGSDWAKYTPLSGQRMDGSEQCGMGLNCCVASGPRGLFAFPLTAVLSRKEGLQINFFASGDYTLQTPGNQKITLIQETDYPVTGEIQLKVQIQKPEKMSILVRIPGWSKETALKVNGESLNGMVPGENYTIQRTWKEGDFIDLKLDMRGRIVRLGSPSENIAIVRGPVVLSRDSRLPGPAMESIIRPVTVKAGYIDLEAVDQELPGIWMEFKASFIPESYAEAESQSILLELCDYASAGNSAHDHPFFKVWLPQFIDPGKTTE